MAKQGEMLLVWVSEKQVILSPVIPCLMSYSLTVPRGIQSGDNSQAMRDLGSTSSDVCDVKDSRQKWSEREEHAEFAGPAESSLYLKL